MMWSRIFSERLADCRCAAGELGQRRSNDRFEFGHRGNKKREAFVASLVGLLRSGQRGFGLLGDLVKCRLVVHGQIGQDLAVDIDRCLLQAVHEHAVAHAQLAHGGVDAGDPQRAEFALPVAEQYA